MMSILEACSACPLAANLVEDRNHLRRRAEQAENRVIELGVKLFDARIVIEAAKRFAKAQGPSHARGVDTKRALMQALDTFEARP